MKKVCLVIMCLILVMPLLSACTKVKKTKESLIKYQSKLSQYTQTYVPSSSASQRKGHVVDLSDGKQMRYDMQFAPNNPNFDVKLKDPYSY